MIGQLKIRRTRIKVLQAIISQSTHNSEKCFIQKLYGLKGQIILVLI